VFSYDTTVGIFINLLPLVGGEKAKSPRGKGYKKKLDYFFLIAVLERRQAVIGLRTVHL
jgi:hypothetical protein